jgi:hypothetical protein
MAKPPQTPASAPLASPGNPCNDAINTRTLIPARGIMTPTEPLKFSDARADLRSEADQPDGQHRHVAGAALSTQSTRSESCSKQSAPPSSG